MVCATGATRALLNFRGTPGGADAGGGVSVRAHGDTNQTAPRGELVHVPPTITPVQLFVARASEHGSAGARPTS